MRSFKTIPQSVYNQVRFNSNLSLKFFTKAQCMLCTNANNVLEQAISSPAVKGIGFNLTKIDIMDPKNKNWFEKYCYDVPVLHIESSQDGDVKKHMHYFDKSQLVKDFQEYDSRNKS